MVSRRYAILDDNQLVLERRLDGLVRMLPTLVHPRAVAAMVIGSVAEGRARDGSDIDVLLVLDGGAPSRSDYRWWDREIVPRLSAEETAFPVQPVFVGRSALSTSEPNLRNALARGLVLWDPEALFQ